MSPYGQLKLNYCILPFELYYTVHECRYCQKMNNHPTYHNMAFYSYRSADGDRFQACCYLIHYDLTRSKRSTSWIILALNQLCDDHDLIEDIKFVIIHFIIDTIMIESPPCR